jgi:hypothetical protein
MRGVSGKCKLETLLELEQVFVLYSVSDRQTFARKGFYANEGLGEKPPKMEP